MPKKQPPTRNPLRLFSRFWKRKSKDEKFILIFFTILGTFILTNIIIHQVRVAYERAQYTRAIADLDTLYDEIAAKVGPADEIKDAQRCSYSSMKYTRGPRSCDIYKYFAYNGLTRSQALDKSREITSSIQQSRIAVYGGSQVSIFSDEETEGFIMADFDIVGIKGCSADYIYLSPQTKLDYSGISFGGYINSHGLSVRLHCSGGAAAEYFPVVK